MFGLGDLSIRGKTLLIVIVGLSFQLLLAFVAFFYLEKANERIHHLGEEATSIHQAARIRVPFLEMIIAEKNFILANSETERSEARATFDRWRNEVRDRMRELNQLFVDSLLIKLDPREQELLERFRDTLEAYLASQDQVRELIAQGRQEEAYRLSIGRAKEQKAEARNALSDLMDHFAHSLAVYRLESDREYTSVIRIFLLLLAGILVTTTVLGLMVARSIVSGLDEIVAVASSIAEGNLDTRVDTSRSDAIGRLASEVDRMQDSLRQARLESEVEDWLKSGLTRLHEVMAGDRQLKAMTSNVISEISRHVDAQVGVIYLKEEATEREELKLFATYGYRRRKNLSNSFQSGEGIVGQVLLEKEQILIRNVPGDYIQVTSGSGEASPKNICATPFLYEGEVLGVVELATLQELSDIQMEYLRRSMGQLAVAVHSARGRLRLDQALEEAKELAEELEEQQEELKNTNAELEAQTENLRRSEEELRNQREELQASNEELEEKNELLQRRGEALERASDELETKASELAQASRYKSEFLANMSHELRTPLNSLLLLAQSLVEDESDNLTEEQIESVRIIYNSGNDLLNLINEILDLSKVEAGRMSLQLHSTPIADLAEGVRRSFQHLADEKDLSLEIEVLPEAPKKIVTDAKRLEQVLKNLVSNAIKFTEEGEVRVCFGKPKAQPDPPLSELDLQETCFIAVSDTGIGIEEEHQALIFEAFQQVDGSISRRFGGTGLGLSISQKLVGLLGGELRLESDPGEGSTFTVFFPLEHGHDAAHRPPKRTSKKTQVAPSRSAREGALSSQDSLPEDRDDISEDDQVLLVIEDDREFAKLLYRKSHERGLKCRIATSGDKGLEIAREILPTGIILDVQLPGLDGWEVLSALKEDIRTRHIPVHIVSVEEFSTETLRRGAIGHAEKPVSLQELNQVFQSILDSSKKDGHRILLVEDEPTIRKKTVELLKDEDVSVDEASTGEEALETLASEKYDCLILDLDLPDADGLRLLEEANTRGLSLPPVIVHTAQDISPEQEMELEEYADSIVIKDVRSKERLLDEVSLFLHQVVEKMPERKREMIQNLHAGEDLLKGKTILIADDDMRTVFAISKMLQDRGARTLKAENGKKALERLEENPDLDLVLMDIMMPVMDGLETISRIRSNPKHRKLPIIALTAKAMSEDRDRCIEAGADEYLSKPINQQKLLSMLRVWLYR